MWWKGGWVPTLRRYSDRPNVRRGPRGFRAVLFANRSRRGTLGGRRFSAKPFMFRTGPIRAIFLWWIRFDATQHRAQIPVSGVLTRLSPIYEFGPEHLRR